MEQRPSLQVAANGHLALDLNDSDEQALVRKLIEDYGFHREGEAVVGAGEMVDKDFVNSELRLSAGRDDWSGYYLLSNSSAGDDFLRKLFEGLP